MSPRLIKEMCIRAKKYITENGHPRGMLGKHQSERIRKIVSESTKKRWKSITKDKRIAFINKRIVSACEHKPKERYKVSWKCGFRNIGTKKIFFRSRWKYNYAVYLNYLKNNNKIKKWEHEPDSFLMYYEDGKATTYLPDFKVYNNDGSIEYHEVKGWFDDRSIFKIGEFSKTYGNKTKLIVINEKKYKQIEKEFYSCLQEHWEK